MKIELSRAQVNEAVTQYLNNHVFKATRVVKEIKPPSYGQEEGCYEIELLEDLPKPEVKP